MYLLESPHRGKSNEYTQHTVIVLIEKKKKKKKLSKLSPLTSWPGTMIYPQWLEQLMPRTRFDGPKDVRAFEFPLHIPLS